MGAFSQISTKSRRSGVKSLEDTGRRPRAADVSTQMTRRHCTGSLRSTVLSACFGVRSSLLRQPTIVRALLTASEIAPFLSITYRLSACLASLSSQSVSTVILSEFASFSSPLRPKASLSASSATELRGQVLSVASTPEHLRKAFVVRNHAILQTINPAYRMPRKSL
jgi:hypothetical protein